MQGWIWWWWFWLQRYWTVPKNFNTWKLRTLVNWLFDHFWYFSAIGCSKPSGIANGKLLSSGDLFYEYNVITYQCDFGFVMIGESQRTCQGNGQWSGSEPQCEGVCLILSWLRFVKSLSLGLLEFNRWMYKWWHYNNIKQNRNPSASNASALAAMEMLTASWVPLVSMSVDAEEVTLVMDSVAKVQTSLQRNTDGVILHLTTASIFYCLLVGEADRKQCFRRFKKRCHQNADCITSDAGKYTCQCRDGYNGDGFKCEGDYLFLILLYINYSLLSLKPSHYCHAINTWISVKYKPSSIIGNIKCGNRPQIFQENIEKKSYNCIFDYIHISLSKWRNVFHNFTILIRTVWNLLCYFFVDYSFCWKYQ